MAWRIFKRREVGRDEEAARRRRIVFASRPRPAWRLRRGVQLLSLAVVALIGVQFAIWVGNMQQGVAGGVRPPGVEGFLPISALLSLRHLFETGEFSRIHPAGLVIFSLAMLTGLLLKKAFCSWICPVGTLSEWLARAAHRVFGRRFKLPARIDRPLMILKYLLLAFFVHAVFFRMTPRAVALFLDSPYNKVADVKMLHFFTHMSTTTAVVLAALAVLSFLVPYFWCRYLCPYGALLGIVSWLSPLKVVRVPSACSGCGHCAAACPAYLDVDRTRTVHSPECTGCLECVNRCPAPGALQVQGPPFHRRAMRPAVFAALVALLFYGGIGVARSAGWWRTEITDREYRARIQGIDGPQYPHFRGQVPRYGPQD